MAPPAGQASGRSTLTVRRPPVATQRHCPSIALDELAHDPQAEPGACRGPRPSYGSKTRSRASAGIPGPSSADCDAKRRRTCRERTVTPRSALRGRARCRRGWRRPGAGGPGRPPPAGGCPARRERSWSGAVTRCGIRGETRPGDRTAASHGCAPDRELPQRARPPRPEVVGQPQQLIAGLVDDVEEPSRALRRGVDAPSERSSSAAPSDAATGRAKLVRDCRDDPRSQSREALDLHPWTGTTDDAFTATREPVIVLTPLG